jgi:hypothetical protein
VKGLLKVDQCTSGTYLIGEDNLSISFSDGSCETGWKVSLTQVKEEVRMV